MLRRASLSLLKAFLVLGGLLLPLEGITGSHGALRASESLYESPMRVEFKKLRPLGVEKYRFVPRTRTYGWKMTDRWHLIHMNGPHKGLGVAREGEVWHFSASKDGLRFSRKL